MLMKIGLSINMVLQKTVHKCQNDKLPDSI
jgi:hypothetical protein